MASREVGKKCPRPKADLKTRLSVLGHGPVTVRSDLRPRLVKRRVESDHEQTDRHIDTIREHCDVRLQLPNPDPRLVPLYRSHVGAAC